MYKISLSISNTCPNRDGTKGSGGCIFCSAGGSGDFAADYLKSIPEQINEAKQRVLKKNKGGKFVAYFQSFTSTYTSPQKLKQSILAAAEDSDILAVSIATRADCLGEDILEVLSECNKIIPITVEMGLQTVHQKTAEVINRCCDLEEYVKAQKSLEKIGIPTVYHVIFGLPNEDEDMMLETVRFVADSGALGIKIQLLHILKNTALYDIYKEGKIKPLSMQEYFSLVGKALELLPKEMVICRLTGDGDKKILAEPQWSGDKKRVLNALNKYLDDNDIVQGRKYKVGK